MEIKKHILKDEPLIREYLHALKIDDESIQCALLNSLLKSNPTKAEIEVGDKYNSVGSYIIYQIIELGGMDFRFEYRSYKIINGKIKSSCTAFTFKNGEVKFNGRSEHFSYGFKNTLERYKLVEFLKIRVPNLTSFFPESYTENIIGYHDKNKLTVYNRINSNMFSRQGVIPENLASKFSHEIFDIIFDNGYKIDIETKMLDFDLDVDLAIDHYYSKNYDIKQFNGKTLRLIYENGWSILTNKFDLINLYLAGKRQSGIIFFKKGTECIMLASNGLSLTNFQPIKSFFNETSEAEKLRDALSDAGLWRYQTTLSNLR